MDEEGRKKKRRWQAVMRQPIDWVTVEESDAACVECGKRIGMGSKAVRHRVHRGLTCGPRCADRYARRMRALMDSGD